MPGPRCYHILTMVHNETHLGSRARRTRVQRIHLRSRGKIRSCGPDTDHILDQNPKPLCIIVLPSNALHKAR